MADRSGSRPGLCGASTLFDIVIKTRRDTRAAGLWVVASAAGLDFAVSVIPRRNGLPAERSAGGFVAFHAVRKTRLKQGPTLTDRPGFRPGEIRLT